MTTRIRYEAFVSPIGIARFPFLTQADTQHDATGVYHVDVAVPKELAQPFIDRLDGVLDRYIEEQLNATQKATLARKPVFRVEMTYPSFPEGATDAEKQTIKDLFVPEETDNVKFRTKMVAQFTTKTGEIVTQQPIVIDSQAGERVTNPVFSGSTLRVKGQIVPYVSAASQIVGLSLRLKSAQIIELVTGTGAGYWSDFDSDDS